MRDDNDKYPSTYLKRLAFGAFLPLVLYTIVRPVQVAGSNYREMAYAIRQESVLVERYQALLDPIRKCLLFAVREPDCVGQYVIPRIPTDPVNLKSPSRNQGTDVAIRSPEPLFTSVIRLLHLKWVDTVYSISPVSSSISVELQGLSGVRTMLSAGSATDVMTLSTDTGVILLCGKPCWGKKAPGRSLSPVLLELQY